MAFDYSLDFKTVDFRRHPERYRIGIGEQGVLLVEPYKSEILPHWRFRTEEVARESSRKIYQLFLDYKSQEDFVGMDMACKFLQMGYTRARRYANHKTGRKYLPAAGGGKKRIVAPQEADWATSEKAKAAAIFYEAYLKAREDKGYKKAKERHERRSES